MNNGRKEEIILATLELASKHGLGNVSMNMIADKIKIKKPSLYNHFTSREEIVEAMYQYLREQAKKNTNATVVDFGMLFANKTALEVLQLIVENYVKMNQDEHIQMFYRVVYSERCIEPMAARIMAEETERMILATKQLFYAMEIHKLLHFRDADMSAVSFAMMIHGLLDYETDKNMVSNQNTQPEHITDSNQNVQPEQNRTFENSSVLNNGLFKQTGSEKQNLLQKYLVWFCEENKVS